MYKNRQGTKFADALSTEPALDAHGLTIGTNIYPPSSIDENFSWDTIVDQLKGKLFVYLGRVKQINSAGSGKWHRNNPFAGRSVELREISPAFAFEIHMKPITRLNCHVASVFIEFNCQNAHSVGYLFDLDNSTPKEFLKATSNRECPSCRSILEMETLVDELKYLEDIYQLRSRP